MHNHHEPRHEPAASHRTALPWLGSSDVVHDGPLPDRYDATADDVAYRMTGWEAQRSTAGDNVWADMSRTRIVAFVTLLLSGLTMTMCYRQDCCHVPPVGKTLVIASSYDRHYGYRDDSGGSCECAELGERCGCLYFPEAGTYNCGEYCCKSGRCMGMTITGYGEWSGPRDTYTLPLTGLAVYQKPAQEYINALFPVCMDEADSANMTSTDKNDAPVGPPRKPNCKLLRPARPANAPLTLQGTCCERTIYGTWCSANKIISACVILAAMYLYLVIDGEQLDPCWGIPCCWPLCCLCCICYLVSESAEVSQILPPAALTRLQGIPSGVRLHPDPQAPQAGHRRGH